MRKVLKIKPWEKYSFPPSFRTTKERAEDRFEAKFGKVSRRAVVVYFLGAFICVLAVLADFDWFLGLGLVVSVGAMLVLLTLGALYAYERHKTFINHARTGFEIRIKMMWRSIVGPRND